MTDTIKAGIVLGLLLHFLQIPIYYSHSLDFGNGVAFLIMAGLTQLLYMIPGTLIALLLRRTRMAQGILLVAGFTFLASAVTCGALIVGATHANHQ